MERRNVPRFGVSWSGRCRVQELLDAEWMECRIVDISLRGIGLEVFGSLADDAIGHRIVVEVEAPTGGSTTGQSVSVRLVDGFLDIRLVGEIRHVDPGFHGGTRVGFEFGEISQTDRSLINALLVMRATLAAIR